MSIPPGRMYPTPLAYGQVRQPYGYTDTMLVLGPEAPDSYLWYVMVLSHEMVDTGTVSAFHESWVSRWPVVDEL